MRRGLTIIELLAALVILAGLVTVCLAWLQTATTAATLSGPRIQWQAAANEVARVIRDDLLVGDAPREVSIERDVLGVTTRRGGSRPGSVRHEYKRRAGDDTLVRVERQPSGRPAERVLLTGVRSFTCELDRDLYLVIESRDGVQAEHRLELPR